MKKIPKCWTIHDASKHGRVLLQCLNNGCLLGQGAGDTKFEAYRNLSFFMQKKIKPLAPGERFDR